MPLRNHRLSWEQRKLLQERLQQRASLLRTDLGRQAALEAAGVERDVEELGEIDAALGRLDTGAFGACLECGAPIAWDRLLTRPQLRRCTRCEAALEHGSPPLRSVAGV